MQAGSSNSKTQKRMKKPRTSSIATGLSVLIVAGFSLAAQAVMPTINGSIAFYGGAVLDGSIGTATAFTSYVGPKDAPSPLVLADSQAGDYASVPNGTPVVFSPFTFNPAPASPFTMWQLTVGATTYSLSATSVEVVRQDNYFLNIQGQGIASITGYADTPGSWTITDTGSTPILSFGATTAAVPEPSVAAFILFLLPIGWCLAVRRKVFSPEKCAVRVRS